MAERVRQFDALPSARLTNVSVWLGIALATLSLTVSLTCAGYALARGVWNPDAVSSMTNDQLSGMIALDTIVWQPVIYMICWLSLRDIDLNVRASPFFLTFCFLLLFDTVDDIEVWKPPFVFGHEGLVLGFDVLINLGLFACLWRLVTGGKAKLGRPATGSKLPPILNNRMVRGYLARMSSSLIGPVLLFIFANSSKVARILQPSGRIAQLIEPCDFIGMAVILVTLSLFAIDLYNRSSKRSKARMAWVVLALVVFTFYPCLDLLVDSFEQLGLAHHYVNWSHIGVEWIVYAATLLTLLVGSVGGQLINPYPALRIARPFAIFSAVVSVLTDIFLRLGEVLANGDDRVLTTYSVLFLPMGALSAFLVAVFIDRQVSKLRDGQGSG